MFGKVVLSALCLILPSTLAAQNRAVSVQAGEENRHEITQKGRNSSVVLQIGTDNDVRTWQEGGDNLAVVHQSGRGLSRRVEQVGNGHTQSVTQVSSDFGPKGTRSVRSEVRQFDGSVVFEVR